MRCLKDFNEPFEIVKQYLRKQNNKSEPISFDFICEEVDCPEKLTKPLTNELLPKLIKRLDLDISFEPKSVVSKKISVVKEIKTYPSKVCKKIVTNIINQIIGQKLCLKRKSVLYETFDTQKRKLSKINKNDSFINIKTKFDSEKEASPADNVIVVDSENEAEEFDTKKVKWILSGGIQIGNSHILNKGYKPRVLFEENSLTISFKTDENQKTVDLLIDYKTIESIDTFFDRNHCTGSFRLILKSALKAQKYYFLADCENTKRIDMFFKDVTSMVEKGFFERLKDIPLLQALIFCKQNEIHQHNYNTRKNKTSETIKNTKNYKRLGCSKKLNSLKTLFTYPKSGENPITITRRDVQFLRPGQMLNDTIIDFYLRYITEECEVDPMKIHIFNSFFFKVVEKNLEKTGSWTKRTNIFEKDFVVIPVNEGMHWKAVVICYPLNATRDRTEWAGEDNHARIVILDSIKVHRKQERTLSLIRKFLTREFEAKFNRAFEFDPENLQGVEMSLAKQANSVDCGVYLLEYIERFCRNPFGNTAGPDTLGQYLFSPQYIAQKREEIKQLIQRLGNISAD